MNFFTTIHIERSTNFSHELLSTCISEKPLQKYITEARRQPLHSSQTYFFIIPAPTLKLTQPITVRLAHARKNAKLSAAAPAILYT
jgi:hypothetical protein